MKALRTEAVSAALALVGCVGLYSLRKSPVDQDESDRTLGRLLRLIVESLVHPEGGKPQAAEEEASPFCFTERAEASEGNVPEARTAAFFAIPVE